MGRLIGHRELVAKVGELDGRVSSLERRVTGLEEHLKKSLDQFGGYKNQTREELSVVQGQLQQIVGVLESLVQNAENQADKERAAALLRRARNNLTRASRAAS